MIKEWLWNIERIIGNIKEKKTIYVYGGMGDCTHKDCTFRNRYKDFVPVEPLHNKYANGGV